jgi:hypothetical protein
VQVFFVPPFGRTESVKRSLNVMQDLESNPNAVLLGPINRKAEAKVRRKEEYEDAIQRRVEKENLSLRVSQADRVDSSTNRSSDSSDDSDESGWILVVMK